MSKINYYYIVRYFGDVFSCQNSECSGLHDRWDMGKQPERMYKIMIK